jgi:site-specific DNA recombinase
LATATCAGIIAHLFGWYALKEAAEIAREAGLEFRRTGAAVPVSTIHSILGNHIYTGEFEWKGHLAPSGRPVLS